MVEAPEPRVPTARARGLWPTELGKFTALRSYIYLDGNKLSGTIPTDLARLTKLGGGIYLQQNKLSGSVPTELAALSRDKWEAAGQPDADLEVAVGRRSLAEAISEASSRQKPEL